MKGSELRRIRNSMGLSHKGMADLIGFTGTNRNNANRVRKYEKEDQVPLHIARFIWLMEVFYLGSGQLPPFPDWQGYIYDHTPDPGHEKVNHG